MRIRFMLLSGAVLVGCLGLVPDAPKVFQYVSAAEAQNVSLSFTVFYNGLRDDGDWVNYNNRYVFVPTDIDDNWRPYTHGHWGYTKVYGWVWISDERFGWATYHYGRWGYGQDIGWYWVPGKRWAPAWVSWRKSDRDVSWAPLPPDYNDDYFDRRSATNVSVSAYMGALPFYFWVNVPARNFQDRDLNARIVRDQDENRRLYDRSQFAGPVVVENNTIINNVINVNFIQQQSGKPVETVAVKTVDDPTAAKQQQPGQQATISVFQGALQADPAAKPAEVKPVDQVTQQQASKPKLPAPTPTAIAPVDSQKPAAGTDPNAPAPAAAPDATKPVDATKTPDATKQPDATKTPDAAKLPDATKTPDAAKLPEPPKTEPPKVEPPKAEPPKAVTPAAQPPKVEPPAVEPPKVEPPKAEPPKAVAPAVQPPKVEPPKAEPPKAVAPAEQPPKVEPPKVEPPKAEPPKAVAPAEQPPKAEPPKVEPPKAEPPKAVAPAEQPPKAKPPKAEPKPKTEVCKDGEKDCPPAN